MKIIGIETDESVKFIISDNGVGIAKDSCEELNKSLLLGETPKDGHIGLYNVNSRLKIIFGNECGIRVDSTLNIGTDVYVIIPKTQL